MGKTDSKNNLLQCIVAVAAVCLVFAVMQGIHDNYGIMMNGIIEHTNISYSSVSFVIAVGQILYGVTQPLFGMIALKKSNAFVMICGILLMAVGLVATPFCTTLFTLLIFFGIILPAGTGALCFGIVMGAIAPIIGEKRAAMVSGIVQASAGIGDALMSPSLQYLTAWKGIFVSMPVFSIPILIMLPIAFWLGHNRKKNEQIDLKQTSEHHNKDEKLFTILGNAVRGRTYWCLLIGFSTCGFHMAIIETHLFSQYVSSGISGNIASFALTVYGITTMLGAVITGFLGQKIKMKNVLSMVYAIRVIIAVGFIFIPKSIPFAFIATALLGLTGDSTVPPTTGIISAKVGVAKMAVVYGSIFIGHQIGAFASAWLGGVLVNTALSYSALWIVDLCLSFIAATASFKIRE
mgnify:CR=1 FL=1